MDTPETTTSATAVFGDPITLTAPIVRGSATIDTIQLRKPKSGELRGCNLPGLMNGDVDQLMKVLPRISNPPLLPAEVADMDPADMAECAGQVMLFLLTPTQRALLDQQLKS
jgi:hypothetical protein